MSPPSSAKLLTCDFVPSMIKGKWCGLCGIDDDFVGDNHSDKLKEGKNVSKKTQGDF